MIKSKKINKEEVMRRQIDEGFCGPAVLEHYLQLYDYDVDQKFIAEVVGGYKSVVKNGVSPEKLAQAIKIIAPDLTFWVKRFSSWKDVCILSEVYTLPRGNGVTLDFQGVFVDSDVLTRGILKEDNGHYVLVTNVYKNGQVRFLDPSFNYPRYLNQNIILKRWWDVDLKIEKRLIFLVTRKDDMFPPCVEMINLLD